MSIARHPDGAVGPDCRVRSFWVRTRCLRPASRAECAGTGQEPQLRLSRAGNREPGRTENLSRRSRPRSSLLEFDTIEAQEGSARYTGGDTNLAVERHHRAAVRREPPPDANEQVGSGLPHDRVSIGKPRRQVEGGARTTRVHRGFPARLHLEARAVLRRVRSERVESRSDAIQISGICRA